MHHTCFHSTFHPVSGQGQPVSEWSGQRALQEGPRFKLEHSHGSRVLKKRRHADLKEDGTLGNFEKRRDCGSKRGHKQGSLPQFLKEQADQRAGQTLMTTSVAGGDGALAGTTTLLTTHIINDQPLPHGT